MESMGGMDGMVLPELWYTWMVWMVIAYGSTESKHGGRIRPTDDEYYFWRSRDDNPNDEPMVFYFGRFSRIDASDEPGPWLHEFSGARFA
jgi:hypothetical protein